MTTTVPTSLRLGDYVLRAGDAPVLGNVRVLRTGLRAPGEDWTFAAPRLGDGVATGFIPARHLRLASTHRADVIVHTEGERRGTAEWAVYADSRVWDEGRVITVAPDVLDWIAGMRTIPGMVI